MKALANPKSIDRATIGAPGYAELLLVIAIAAVYCVFIYFLPQAGLVISSDVSWIYRLQVADPAEVGPVPYGLALFSGRPMGLIEACAAHYAAFGRLNCLDVASFRMIAAIAGANTDIWHMIYLVTGLVMLGLLYWIIRRLGLPSMLALCLAAGALVAPAELWLGYRTSEPRNAVMLLLALVSLLTLRARIRNIAAAGLMAVAVQLKEPTVACWPLVWFFALAIEARDFGSLARTSWRGLFRATLPHLIAGVTVVCYMAFVALTVPNQFSYALMITGSYPDPTVFLLSYWGGLAPELLEPTFAFAAIALIGIPGVFVLVSRQRRHMFLSALGNPLIIATLLGGLIAIIAHGAFYYMTKRLVGDNRYVCPANIVMVLMFAAATAPLAEAAGRKVMHVAVLVSLACVVWHALQNLWGNDETLHAMAVVGSIVAVVFAGAVLTAVRWVHDEALWSDMQGFAIWASFAALIAVILTVHIHSALVSGGQNRANMDSWARVQEQVAHAPEGASIRLLTDTPLMIETVWGLQTEMLFAGRHDLALLMEPLDKSYYQQESGLVRAAITAFNADRPAYTHSLYLDRAGNAQLAKPSVVRPWQSWAFLIITAPHKFYFERYVRGWPGYLRSSWNEPFGRP